ncbi:hypothetical protein [Candidatus Methanoperedens nitratireducens]|uniref:hypothetical protein n=1 Tax=Candidatus Methanoperedens nitratireducens TaxID=1392998 RepID=UPI000BB83A36|nr:hypothetical protein [Candidatus Methanoperedens nitroreducens]
MPVFIYSLFNLKTADERRFFLVRGFIELFVDWLFSVTEFDEKLHRKGRKERKVKRQEPLCPLLHSMKKHRLSELRTRMIWIRRIFTDTINPCASVSSVQSVFFYSFSGMKPTCMKVSAFICVHLRFLNWVIFRTGFTGFTGYASFFNPINPVILSNWKCQPTAPRQSAKLLEGAK